MAEYRTGYNNRNACYADRTGNGAFYFDRRSGFADDCGSVPRL